MTGEPVAGTCVLTEWAGANGSATDDSVENAARSRSEVGNDGIVVSDLGQCFQSARDWRAAVVPIEATVVDTNPNGGALFVT